MFHSSFVTFFYVVGTSAVAVAVAVAAAAAVAVVDCSNLNFDVVITLVNVQGVNVINLFSPLSLEMCIIS
jgi:hypothetical protein